MNAAISVYDKNGDLITQMNRLQIKDSNGVLLSENSVMVDITLWEVMNDIPVEVNVEGTPADGYNVTGVNTVPVTLNLVGTPEALAELNGKIVAATPISVEGASESFTETIDISETLGDIEELQLVSGHDPSVTVTVQIEKTGDQTLQMPLSNLEVENRPSNMTLAFSPADQIMITVHAEDGESRRLLLNDMKAKIDLAVCAEPGDYEIPVEIQLPDGYSLVSEVVLLVNATEQEPIEEELSDKNN
jgi:YbbR domain-containing protein